MATSKSEAVFEFKQRLNRALALNDDKLKINIDMNEDLSKIIVSLGHVVMNESADRVVARLNNSSEYYFPIIEPAMKELGYKGKATYLKQSHIKNQTDLMRLDEPLLIQVQAWSFSIAKAHIRTEIAKVRKELAELKKSPDFIEGVVIYDPHYRKEIPINLLGKSTNDRVQQYAHRALTTNYNNILNGFDLTGVGYKYLYSKSPSKKPINIITLFEANFNYHGKKYKLHLDFSHPLPMVVVLLDEQDVTTQFFQNSYLPAHLHGFSDYKIKAFLRSHLGRSAVFEEFKVQSNEIKIFLTEFMRFRKVTLSMDDNDTPMFIQLDETGFKAFHALKGSQITSKQDDLNKVLQQHPELITDMKMANRRYYQHLMLDKLKIPKENIRNIYFH